MGYFQTLIAVADDCPVTESQAPPVRNGKKSVANLQYDMLVKQPGVLTQEDVLFKSWFLRQDFGQTSDAEVGRLREQFFSKPRACLRSSPLPKRYGWGLLFDQEGRVTLCPMESAEYGKMIAGEVPEIKVVKALRSKRA